MKKPIADEQVILEDLHQAHKGGNTYSALEALRVCALWGVAMPPWLAKIVSRAIGTFERGEPDKLLGLGDEKRLARWRKSSRARRDAAIRWNFHHLDELLANEGMGRKVSREKLKASLAKRHHLSVKAIDKIIYRKSPTFSTKK